MNIFLLDSDPVLAAQMQCDKHVVKMIVETAQILSTAHRMLDGEIKTESRIGRTGKERLVKVWQHKVAAMDSVLYQVTHAAHPCTVWTMTSVGNYIWLYEHFCALCDEYTHRYGRVHKTDTILRDILSAAPETMPDIGLTPFVKAMKSQPTCEAIADPIEAYRAFYKTKAQRFTLKWTNRTPPEWMGWATPNEFIGDSW